MKFEVEIDDSLFVAAAQSAVRSALRGGDGYRDGAPGYVAIDAQVRAYLKAQDYTAQIAAAVALYLPDVLADTVRESLRAHVKATVKAMKERGELSALIDEVRA